MLFGEYLAAVVVALMYAGGQYLESFAEGRASREMTALLARLPRSALRYRDGRLEEVALEAIEPGDRLLIRHGEIAPVDGRVAQGGAVLDQSALTGESLPVRLQAGEAVLSGSLNAGDAFELTASRRAAESTYAGIVRLIEAAQRAKAPMARLADRFAMVFLAVTVVLAGGAWLVTTDPIRGLAVLVVATPCPLILAVPVAIISGVSRAAKDQLNAAPSFAYAGSRRTDTAATAARTDTGARTTGSVGPATGDTARQTDRTSWSASDVQAIRNLKVSLPQAIDTAEKQGQGKAIDAEFKRDGTAGQYEIKVLSDNGNKLVEYKVDGNSGQVTGTDNQPIEKYFTRLKPADIANARTSLKQALATAEKQANGKAIDAEVEREGSGVQYRVTVASGDRTQDVRIDGNGQVVSR